jgi:hypothetical protein
MCSIKGARGSVVVKALCYKPKVAGSIPDEVIFLNLLNPSGSTRPWVYSASNRNEKIIMFLGSKVRRVRRADNLTTICEPIV